MYICISNNDVHSLYKLIIKYSSISVTIHFSRITTVLFELYPMKTNRLTVCKDYKIKLLCVRPYVIYTGV